MWVMVMFDLPTDTPKARKFYANFRKFLLQDGFLMIQFSVYARHCPSDENTFVHIQRTKLALPPEGEVRILTLTDKQYGKMVVFYGREKKPVEKSPEQISLF